jgi:hypothetical protein
VTDVPAPVHDVTKVWVDGEVVDPSGHRVDDHRLPVRTDGDRWPDPEDLRTVTMTTSGLPEETGQAARDLDARPSGQGGNLAENGPLTAAHRRLRDWTAHLAADGPRWGGRQFFVTGPLGIPRRWVGRDG